MVLRTVDHERRPPSMRVLAEAELAFDLRQGLFPERTFFAEVL
jgi:hypothetical protein